MAIKNKVSEVAGKRRLQVSDLARAAGISWETADRLWNGKTTGIDFRTLNALCKALGCQVCDLLVYIPEETEANNG